MRVLVTGSQLWTDKQLIFEELDRLYYAFLDNHDCTNEDLFVVVHGACPNGADKFAHEWWEWRSYNNPRVRVERHPADWKGPRKRGAGYARNVEMVALGVDYCLAFILDESPGATHTRDLAKKAGIETLTFTRSSNMAVPARRVEDELILYGVQLIFRNFSGAEKPFNKEGDRNFSIRLDETTAKELESLGWNVRSKPPREEGEEPLYHLPVKVLFKKGSRPPRIFLLTESSNSRNQLNEDTAMLVDFAEFINVDVTIRPYNYDFNGNQGVKAYLKTMYGTLREDPLDLKYKDYRNITDQIELESMIENGSDVEYDSGWFNDETQLENEK